MPSQMNVPETWMDILSSTEQVIHSTQAAPTQGQFQESHSLFPPLS